MPISLFHATHSLHTKDIVGYLVLALVLLVILFLVCSRYGLPSRSLLVTRGSAKPSYFPPDSSVSDGPTNPSPTSSMSRGLGAPDLAHLASTPRLKVH